MRRYASPWAKPKKSAPARPRETFWFIQEPTGPGESVRVYSMTGCDLHRDAELDKPGVRLFDPAKDSRGPAVKIALTYPAVKESTWHPETEGSYLICFDGRELPEHLRHNRLHFGSVSSPQATKAAAHRILLDILAATPGLRPFLVCRKMPCVFCKDHPDAPGGSFVPVELDSLPPPCEPGKVAKFYM